MKRITGFITTLLVLCFFVPAAAYAIPVRGATVSMSETPFGTLDSALIPAPDIDPNAVPTPFVQIQVRQTPKPTKPVQPEMPYMLTVDLTNQVVTAFTYDDDYQYSIIEREMICSTGTGNNTPMGEFTLGSHLGEWYLFTRWDCYVKYATRISGEIFFHSVMYNEKDDKTMQIGAWNNLGKAVSHGCVRLIPDDAKWIHNNCAEGTKIVIYRGEPDKELTASLKPPKK